MTFHSFFGIVGMLYKLAGKEMNCGKWLECSYYGSLRIMAIRPL